MRVDIVQGFQGGVATSGVFPYSVVLSAWRWRRLSSCSGQAAFETVVSEGRLEENAFGLTCSLRCDVLELGAAAARGTLRGAQVPDGRVVGLQSVRLGRKEGCTSVTSCRLS